MQERIIMNSENLQKLFVKEYEDFFSKNNLIVSCPHTINRWNIAHLHGIKVRINQKLPTKLYLGINIRKDDKIYLTTFTQYIQDEQKFETNNVEKHTNKDIITKMTTKIKEKLIENWYNQGIDISLFSENERGTGINIATSETILIALVTHILWNKVLPQQLEDYQKFLESKEFKNIYTTAKNIMESNLPIDKKHINSTGIFTASMNNGNICFWLDSKEYLQEMYPKALWFNNNLCLNHLGLSPTNLLEYSIISFGALFREHYNTETYLQQQESYNNTLKYYKLFKKDTTDHIDLLNILYLKIFKTAKEAIIHPNEEHLANRFFQAVNRLGSYQTFIEKDMNLYRDIVFSFKQDTTFNNENLWLIPISSAKPGGTFLCITNIKKSRETIEKTIDTLHKAWHKTANLQYISWEDGISEEHLKIEQYIDKGIYSKYIQKDTCILKKCCSNEKRIWSHESLRKNLPDGIVFDTIDKKIYIEGKPMTHEDLYTQSGTVEIMTKVCCEGHHKKSTNNKELPASSYSKNKNEMMGKIIIPLQKIIEKKYKKQFSITCTGNTTDFDIHLDTSAIPIYFIYKTEIS